jgi:hypothetical protein
MKMKITLCSLLLSLTTFSQNIAYLDYNNVSALCSNTSTYFVNQAGGTAAYTVPQNENKNTIYSSSMWITAENESSEVVGSATLYGGGEYDFFPGPIADDYNASEYNSFANQLWVVTKSEIETHQLEYNDIGYVTPPSILDWPGNGNTSIGIAEQLAPFIDLNNNGIYEPESGDYPCIKGDQAIYSIMNDENGNRNVTSLDSMRIEMHIMFYQYDDNLYLNNTTFFEVSIFNRSNQTYTNVHLGSFTDFDIGGALDDMIGSDSTRNILYAYNGDLFDENAFGSLGYEEDVPACGIQLLNHTASSIVGFEDVSGFNVPSTTAQYHFFLNGLRPDGSPQTNPSGAMTNFTNNAKNSSEFTAINAALPAQDVQGVLNCAFNEFTPDSKITASYAVSFFRDSVDNPFEAVDGVLKTADSIQEFYDNNIVDCQALSVNEIQEKFEIGIYPNPANNFVNVIVDGNFDIELIDSKGSLILTKPNCIGLQQINVSQFDKGLYFIQVKTEKGIQSKKVIIE